MRKIMLRAAAVGTAMMLTAAGCKQSNDTIYVTVNKEKPVPVFDGINKDLQDYLAAPVPLKLSVDLSGAICPLCLPRLPTRANMSAST